MEKRRVVITGLGAVTPLGHTARETWEAAKAGVCGIAPITLYDHSAQKVSLAGEVKEFDPSGVLEKKEIRRMDRFAQFAVTAAAEAMAHSGLDLEREDRARMRRRPVQRHRRHRHPPDLLRDWAEPGL